MTGDVQLAYFGAYGDAVAWRTFACDVHGLQAVEVDGKLCFRMDDKLWRIAIETDQPRGCAYIGLETDPAHFEILVSRLNAANIPVEINEELAHIRRVHRLARFTGPGEVPMELVCGLTSADRPFASPLGTEFVTGRTGMGHFAISVADTDAALAFYRDVLGFRLTDTIVNAIAPGENRTRRTYFCRGGKRHHTVAILGIPGMTGVHHIFIEGATMQAVGRAWDKVAGGAAPVIMTLGQHLNDPAISYYCVCPGRFGFEFGWDSMLIEDDAGWQPKLWDNGFTWGHELVMPKPKPKPVAQDAS